MDASCSHNQPPTLCPLSSSYITSILSPRGAFYCHTLSCPSIAMKCRIPLHQTLFKVDKIYLDCGYTANHSIFRSCCNSLLSLPRERSKTNLQANILHSYLPPHCIVCVSNLLAFNKLFGGTYNSFKELSLRSRKHFSQSQLELNSH